jgi:hypothetical protein
MANVTADPTGLARTSVTTVEEHRYVRCSVVELGRQGGATLRPRG